ncbi:hypothetical protein BJ165DRAFT_1459579 [Panaeolus papilionaceus]|nr:hypothetical protein BJ165DRAFT_1459579 [Panaeolus papilionaceus]
MNAEPAKDSSDERLSRTVKETETEEGIDLTRYNEHFDHQQSSYTPSNSSSIINTAIYPSWSCVLPLFIKGLLFPPLAGFYRRRYYKHGTPADLTKSMQFAFASLATTHSSHPSLPFYKLRLAQDLRSRYRSSLNSIDLTLALLLQRTAINNLPVAHPDRNWHREELYGSITERYERYSDASDLDLLLEIEETALADVPPDSPEAQWWKESKAKTYDLRYKRTMNPSDLQLQIDWCIASMDALDSDEPSFLKRASTLCSAYINRFNQYRIMDDLVLALFWGHHSLRDSSSIGAIECAIRYQTLAMAYGTRYDFMGLVGDNDRATDLIKQAIQRMPSSHSFSLMLRHNVGVRYLDRGQFTRSQQDLDMAIEWLSPVLEGYPRTDPRGAICAGNLSTAYMARYNLQPSRLEDLESAVELVLRCVQGLGDSHPRSALFQGKLSTALHTRYSRHRNKKDLDAAIHWCTSSIALTQPNTKPWNGRQNRLGNLYLSSYRHTGRADHLDEAMSLLMSVVASTPQDDDDSAEFYMDLADAYSAVYNLRGGVEHRDAIMRWNVAAVQVAKPDNKRLQVYKYSLGFEYYNRYYRLRDEEDLDNALKYVSEALALAPSDDSTRASYNRALGDIYRERYNLSRSVDDGDEALLKYRNAAQSQNSNPIHIWHVVNRWARFAETMQNAQDCIDAYMMAFKILPELFWLGSDLKSRHHALIAFGINDATNQAVTGCIRFQRLPLAVEFLEQSLAMTFQQLLGLQRDLGNLEDQFPAYASMLETLSTKIRALTLSANDVPHDKAVGSVESSAQSKLVIERNTLLEKIRELPEFESFLLPTQFEKLQAAAVEGPIILLNTNQRFRHYCDALILLPGGSIAHIVLHKVIADDVVKQAGALKKALKAYGIQTRGVDSEDDLSRAGRVRTAPKPNKDAAFQPLLDWLWSHVVSPVFEALKAVSTSSSRTAQT